MATWFALLIKDGLGGEIDSGKHARRLYKVDETTVVVSSPKLQSDAWEGEG